MTDLTDIISVVITRETATIQRAGFAIPMFMAAHTGFSDRAKSYTKLTEVAADFASTSNVYKAAQKYFGQGRGLKTLTIGRRQVPSVTITPTVQNSTAYTLKVNGTTITYTSDSDATAAEIVTGLKAALSSASITNPVASGSTTLILTSATGYSVNNLSSNLTAVNASVTETIDDSLDAIIAADNTWYIMSAETHLEADVLAIAAYIETTSKKYVFASQDSDIITSATDDIFSQLKALGYNNTHYMYSGTADTIFPECALVGYFCPAQPGSNIWAYKTLVGVTADNLTSSQANYAKGKNGSTYETIAGKSVVVGGKVASGEYFDVMIFVDWLTARFQEAIFLEQVNSQKVAYTTQGSAILEADVRRVIAEGIQVGGLADAPAPIVTVPNVLNIDPAVRATRVLPDITFEARLAGAIMYAGISGTVSA